MKKVVVILGFVALLLLVLANMEDDINKLLKKDNLSDNEKQKLKQLRDAIDEKINEESGKEDDTPISETKQIEEVKQKEAEKDLNEEDEKPIIEVKDIWQGKRQFEKTENVEVPEKASNENIPPEQQKKPCKRCGILIPKYPINEVYCPDCKKEIRKEKELRKMPTDSM